MVFIGAAECTLTFFSYKMICLFLIERNGCFYVRVFQVVKCFNSYDPFLSVIIFLFVSCLS